jgi:U3 small nucleolar RNA-associated protein 4
MLFTPDSQRLIISTYSSPRTLVIELPPTTDLKSSATKVLRCYSHGPSPMGSLNRGMKVTSQDDGKNVEIMDFGGRNLPETPSTGFCAVNLAVSRDAQWLAVSDTTRRVSVLNLDTLQVSSWNYECITKRLTRYQYHCALPSFPHEISSIVFDPTAPAMLYIGFKNNSIQIFDVETKMFPEWSHSACMSLPKRFTQLHDSMQGLLFDPPVASTSSETPSSKCIYAWGSSWFCKLDLNPETATSSRSHRKRVRDESKSVHEREPDKIDKHSFEVCTRYRNILSVAFLGPRELLVVERPIADVLQTLPPAFFRPRYGSS